MVKTVAMYIRLSLEDTDVKSSEKNESNSITNQRDMIMRYIRDNKEFSDYLSKNLQSLCDKQMYDISQAKFKGYDTLFQQKLKWYRRIEQRLKKIEPKNSGV